jgi:hypothetical protein
MKDDNRVEDELRLKFKYDPVTGNISKGNRLCKSVSGSGYKRVEFGGNHYYQHRLAWFLYTGNWPKGIIDHINGNKSDNRICNLRDTNQSVNVSNKTARGYFWDKSRGKWRSQFQGKQVGYFDCEDMAKLAYEKAKSDFFKALDTGK